MKSRIFVDQRIGSAGEISLQGDRARYLAKVLRKRAGDAVTLFDGSGNEYACEVAGIARNTVNVSVGASTTIDRESPLRIQLLQGICRSDRMDLVVQKATELGAARITPLAMEHSVSKLSPARAEKRLKHWRAITISACEQSGRTVLPLLDEPVDYSTWLEHHADDRRPRFVLAPGASGRISGTALNSPGVAVLVGPEGGFSRAEVAQAEQTGFRSIGFGPRILRTETAAMAALSALQTLYGDLG